MVFQHVQNTQAGLHKILDLLVVVLAGSPTVQAKVSHFLIISLRTFGLADSLGWFFDIHRVADCLFLDSISFLFGVGSFSFCLSLQL